MKLSDKFKKVALVINNSLSFNKISKKGKKNKIIIDGHIKKSSFRFLGNNNKLLIEKGAIIEDTNVIFYGDNNVFVIKSGVHIIGSYITLEYGDTNIHIGEGTHICQGGYIKCSKGTNISIGWGCIFGINCSIMSGDGHFIFDNKTKAILNKSQSINIGDHVWVGLGVTITKGANIPNETIIASNSLVNRKYYQEHTILGGSPSKVLKEEQFWSISEDQIH